tara:strand:+ start:225 stop:467 length:243 start_codon:yes stop_codon:yes gene_type:complete
MDEEPKLRRVSLYLTDWERNKLAQIVEDEEYGESPRQLLESFVSDLTHSGRRFGWPWGKNGAQEWLESHRTCLKMEREEF